MLFFIMFGKALNYKMRDCDCRSKEEVPNAIKKCDAMCDIELYVPEGLMNLESK